VSQKKLTEMQTLILWALLAKGGEGFQKDIKPEATKADRKALASADEAPKRRKGFRRRFGGGLEIGQGDELQLPSGLVWPRHRRLRAASHDC
jgi:hypothetical protein